MHCSEGQSTAGDWQLIIKLAGARSRRPFRNGIAYEALTIQGERVFFGVNSSNARTSIGALLEAVVEAGLAAKDQGFHHVLFLTNSKNFLQTFKMKTVADCLTPVSTVMCFVYPIWLLKSLGL